MKFSLSITEFPYFRSRNDLYHFLIIFFLHFMEPGFIAQHFPDRFFIIGFFQSFRISHFMKAFPHIGFYFPVFLLHLIVQRPENSCFSRGKLQFLCKESDFLRIEFLPFLVGQFVLSPYAHPTPQQQHNQNYILHILIYLINSSQNHLIIIYFRSQVFDDFFICRIKLAVENILCFHFLYNSIFPLDIRQVSILRSGK